MLFNKIDGERALIDESIDISLINGCIPSVSLIDDEALLIQSQMEAIIARTVPRLAWERRRMSGLSEIDERRLLSKLSLFASGLEGAFVHKVKSIRWDEFADNSIKITFHQRRDLVLNIYVNDEEVEDSIEEAFLSYKDGEIEKLEYNTLPLMVKFLKGLL